MPTSNSRRAQKSPLAIAASCAAPNPVAGEGDASPTANPRVERTAEGPHPLGARSVQVMLERRFPPAPGEAEGPDAPPEKKKSFAHGAAVRRFLKIAAGIALVVSFGWAPLRAMLATTSVEAIINARIETIRSPIGGIVQAPPGKDWSAAAVPPKLVVVDPYADRSRLDDLRRQQDTLESQVGTLGRESQLTAAALDALDLRVEEIPRRPAQADRRADRGADGGAGGGGAKTSQVTASKHRSDQLQRTGDISAAEGDRAQYEWSAATSAEAAARKRLEETKVERDAVAEGVFVGDSYNDSPSAFQRAADLRLRKGELDAQLEAARSQMKHVADQIAEEEQRYRRRAEATVPLPVKGRVWEMLVSPGEYVNKGQDLLRVLNCSNPIVSANVDERVYNRLQVGSPGDVPAVPGRQGLSRDGGQSDRGRGGAGQFCDCASDVTQKPVLRDHRNGRHGRGGLRDRSNGNGHLRTGGLRPHTEPRGSSAFEGVRIPGAEARCSACSTIPFSRLSSRRSRPWGCSSSPRRSGQSLSPRAGWSWRRAVSPSWRNMRGGGSRTRCRPPHSAPNTRSRLSFSPPKWSGS